MGAAIAREIRIDGPGDGAWIMERVGGTFDPVTDHSFSTLRDHELLGGIVIGAFVGGSMTAHMAGDDKRWFSRELAWLAFDYAFNQCQCHKLVAAVRADNHKAIAIDMRGGWQFETVIKDLFAPGLDVVVLGMTRDTCKWLDYRPKQFRSNYRAPTKALTPGVI